MRLDYNGSHVFQYIMYVRFYNKKWEYRLFRAISPKEKEKCLLFYSYKNHNNVIVRKNIAINLHICMMCIYCIMSIVNLVAIPGTMLFSQLKQICYWKLISIFYTNMISETYVIAMYAFYTRSNTDTL